MRPVLCRVFHILFDCYQLEISSINFNPHPSYDKNKTNNHSRIILKYPLAFKAHHCFSLVLNFLDQLGKVHTHFPASPRSVFVISMNS